MALLFSCFGCEIQDNRLPISINIQGPQLSVYSNGKPILSYAIAPKCPENDSTYYCRSGFIHPLHSPAGKIVTDGFPVGHTHQHGLFFAWTNTAYKGDTADYWNQQTQTGIVYHDTLLNYQVQKKEARFTAELLYLPKKDASPVLKEKWQVQVRAYPHYNQIDLIIQQTNISADTFFLLHYHYGALGIRGSRQWNSADSLHFQAPAQVLTSEGHHREAANHSRPLWTTLFGQIDETTAGITIMDHPNNPEHPQPIRVHPEMPYFCLDPAILKSFFLAPGQNYDAQFRIVSYDGRPDTSLFDKLWVEFVNQGISE